MATYYIDNTNGSDAKDGLSDPVDISSPHAAEASTDATHVYVTDGILTDGDADDFFNGDYLYNVTRSAGAIISDYDADDGSGNQVVTHGNIANQVSTDTFYIIKSYETIIKFTEDARSAGDICYVRGGQTHTLASDILFTSDGAINNYIELVGCYEAAETNPWGDGNTTRPVIDFNGGNVHFYLQNDDFWKIKKLDIANGSARNLQTSVVMFLVIEDCIFRDAGGTGAYCATSAIHFNNCQFYDNTNLGLYALGCVIYLDDCVFNGGVGGTSYGLDPADSSRVYAKNCLFGVTTDHGSADIVIHSGSGVEFRNCKLDSTTQVAFSSVTLKGYVRSEDDGQVFGAYTSWYKMGDISKDTGETPPGGSAWAFKCEPNSNCGSEQALLCVGEWLEGFPVYFDGTEQTVTVKVKALDADWSLGGGAGGRPDTSEFFIELEYHDGADSLATVASSEAFADDSYTSFTVTVTPHAAGKATIFPKLHLYESGAAVYVDPIVTFS